MEVMRGELWMRCGGVMRCGWDHGGDAAGEMYFCEEKRGNHSVAAFLLTGGCET